MVMWKIRFYNELLVLTIRSKMKITDHMNTVYKLKATVVSNMYCYQYYHLLCGRVWLVHTWLNCLLRIISLCTDLNMPQLCWSLNASEPYNKISNVAVQNEQISLKISCLISLKALHSKRNWSVVSTVPHAQYGSVVMPIRNRGSFNELHYVWSLARYIWHILTPMK